MEKKLTHWKELQDSPYLGAYCLQPGQELQLTIAKAGVESVVSSDGSKEDCRVIHFKERGVKPMIVNATNAKTISKLAGSPYLENWAGTEIQIYAEKVKAFGEITEALRLRPFKPKKKAVPKCSKCGNAIQAAYGKSPEALAEYTKKNYGAALCASCAEQKAAEATKPTEEAAE